MAKLLLVDDDPDQLEIRSLILEGAGHEVHTAQDAAAAMREFESGRPDVVLMDLRLPRTEDGLALIRRLRAASATVRIIVLSGWAESFQRLPEAAMVERFLRKPVRSQQLVKLLEQVA